MINKLNKLIDENKQQSIYNFECQLHQEDDLYFYGRRWRELGYTCYGKRERTLITGHGLLRISRRYYYNRKTRHGYFHIDDQYALEKGQRISEDVKRMIFDSYGKIPVIEIAKLFELSKQSIYNILTNCGLKHIKYEITPDETVKRVYVQADEDHLKNQKGNRRSNQARLIMIYTDRKKVNNGKYALLNKHYFVFSQQEDFYEKWEEVYEYIYAAYPKCEMIYVGGDGGGWIKSARGVFPKYRTHYIYDLFHFTQSMTRIFGNSKHGKSFKDIAWSAVQHNDRETFSEITNIWLKHVDQEKLGNSSNRKSESQKILNFWDEIRNNWLLKDYHGTSAEGHVSHYLSSRFSNRPKAFSQKRFKSYTRITEYHLNGITYDIYKKSEVKSAESLFVVMGELIIEDGISYRNKSSNIAVLNHSKDSGLRAVMRRIAHGYG